MGAAADWVIDEPPWISTQPPSPERSFAETLPSVNRFHDIEVVSTAYSSELVDDRPPFAQPASHRFVSLAPQTALGQRDKVLGGWAIIRVALSSTPNSTVATSPVLSLAECPEFPKPGAIEDASHFPAYRIPFPPSKSTNDASGCSFKTASARLLP